jgi:predicted DNA-binding protein
VDTQNLTIKLPVDTIRRAKIIAAERGTSISALVAEKIEEAIGEDAEYQVARRRAVQWLEQGWHLGGRP